MVIEPNSLDHCQLLNVTRDLASTKPAQLQITVVGYVLKLSGEFKT